MKIHSVESGPWDDGEYIWNVCKVEKEGKVFDMELFFDSFDDAYQLIRHFSKSVDPLDLELSEEEDE